MSTDFLLPFTYNARIVSVHDGDTINLAIDRGQYEYTGAPDNPIPVRLLGCNAAELGTPGGDAAAANLQALLPPGTAVGLTTAKPDKYAPRWIADVIYRGPDGRPRDLVDDLIAGQWVAPWDGSGVKPTPPWPRTVTEHSAACTEELRARDAYASDCGRCQATADRINRAMTRGMQ